ncbi:MULTISPECIES: DNA repair protein RecN [unclassified Undibacterium]|uniref:DNA repair protein RecN n=1 Tax=unclassified Undibacterium TaxID=2630295 RepID=UPI002AC8A7EF|nr:MULTISPECIES: DNA repair protein RecN [unclassified Undibacterium]MEB0137915.1 DNA repair protein RecN [Undibacterium sp. CCC2.1]MEB0172035.1 DNA repair protein RecN [Undibacterium sp. CCC1.1]MEB0174923.1 DNA repair protein RecN [Undibacterium sp. CCC3.4]MEB0214869.1 DNA repair protein RecN [Undibacterium sp. 5I2]WPX45368.1 DNA repair protein RecN [Undibacterium sp. CCC3.4]
MLRTLAIRDFVIVDTLELEFCSGLSVLTGETGAGKSILIDALSLVLGARGDASMVREHAAKADISAEFSISSCVAAWLALHELNDPEEHLILRRTIDNAGRSKAWINGITATAGQLRELGDLLVDIHGQHAHQALLKSEAQRVLLDTQGGLQDATAEVSARYQAWRALSRQRSEFENNQKDVRQERERLEWQVGELDKLQLKAGEWDSICQEHSRLAHAASLLEGAQAAAELIAESEHPLLSQLSGIQQRLLKLLDYDSALKPVTDALESACINLQESTYALNDYLARTELDPARLRVVEARVETIHSTARRFHVAPEALHSELSSLSAQLQQLAHASDMATLKAEEERAEQAYLQVARQLSAARRQVAGQLAIAVTAAMQDLSMSGGSFAIDLTPCAASAHGLEQIEFLVAGHAGVPARALAKVASGGELARISLAISVITSAATATPTLIFDEVDSGIGGAVAEVVGRLLRRLGQERQVLCVTHLPQVASQANQHLQVSKASHDGRTVSHIIALDKKQRVEEIARMLGGVEITATTRKHARELLAS